MNTTALLSILMVLVSILGGGDLLGQETVSDTTARQEQPQIDEAALEAKLRQQLGESTDSVQSNTPQSGRPVQTALPLNPRISVVGTFFANGTLPKETVVKHGDLGLSEAEIAFNAYVDPFAKGDFFMAFGNESEDPFRGPDSAAAESGEYETELEEAFLTTLALPFGLQVRAGKFRSNFGKINRLHPHTLNFVDTPRMYINYLGVEGLADQGLSLNWLLPLNFFSELTFEITSGKVESPSFAGGGSDLLYLGHFKNFFDLNRHTTLEVGVSGVYGRNNPAGDKTVLGGVDVTLKWKPLRRNRFKSFEWMTEALVSERDMGPASISTTALYSFLRYQIGRRWYIGGRFDYSEFPDHDSLNEKAYSAIFSFFATEFQKLELQYQHGIPAESDNFNRLQLRAVFVIGSHGAHQY